MTKLCPRGKAAAKRKFRVYPSAYANAYASKICAGKIKDPSGVKRKDFKGPKRNIGGISISQQRKQVSADRKARGGAKGLRMVAAGCGMVANNRRKKTKLLTRAAQEVIMLDSIKSKWNALNKKGKMIVVVVGVVAVYAISQIV